MPRKLSLHNTHHGLTGRAGRYRSFGSRFTVIREAEAQRQLFAGLGRVKASILLQDAATLSITLEKATDQGAIVPLLPEELAHDEGIRQARAFLESAVFRSGLSIADSILNESGRVDLPRERTVAVEFRNFPYSSLLALVKGEEAEKPIHISWELTRAPDFLAATVVAEEILHATGAVNRQEVHDLIDRFITEKARTTNSTDHYPQFLKEVEAARALSIVAEEGYLDSLERLRDPYSGKVIQVGEDLAVTLASRMVHHKYASIYRTDGPAVLVKIFDITVPEVRDDFEREARNFKVIYDIGELRPHMPAYYGSGEDKAEGYGFIAMQGIEGLTLDKWRTAVTEGRDNEAPALNDVWMIMGEVLRILALFHRNELIFTDFKLENMIRDTSGQLKFIDFGSVFSKRMNPFYRRFPLTLTPDTTEVLENMSLLQTGAGLDPKSDIFSAGVALYEMLTGYRVLPVSKEDRPGLLALTQHYSSRAMLRQRKAALAPGYLLPISEHIQKGHLLFSDFWHLWIEALEKNEDGFSNLSEAAKTALLLERGTEFIASGLPDDFKFLARAIAEATILREHRVGTVQSLLAVMLREVRDDLKAHNCFCERVAVFDDQLKFVDELPAEAVLRHPITGHWALRTPYAVQISQDFAEQLFLKKTYEEAGQSFYHVTDPHEADEIDGSPLTLAGLNTFENAVYTLVGSDLQQ